MPRCNCCAPPSCPIGRKTGQGPYPAAREYRESPSSAAQKRAPPNPQRKNSRRDNLSLRPCPSPTCRARPPPTAPNTYPRTGSSAIDSRKPHPVQRCPAFPAADEETLRQIPAAGSLPSPFLHTSTPSSATTAPRSCHNPLQRDAPSRTDQQMGPLGRRSTLSKPPQPDRTTLRHLPDARRA